MTRFLLSDWSTGTVERPDWSAVSGVYPVSGRSLLTESGESCLCSAAAQVATLRGVQLCGSVVEGCICCDLAFLPFVISDSMDESSPIGL